MPKTEEQKKNLETLVKTVIEKGVLRHYYTLGDCHCVVGHMIKQVDPEFLASLKNSQSAVRSFYETERLKLIKVIDAFGLSLVEVQILQTANDSITLDGVRKDTIAIRLNQFIS